MNILPNPVINSFVVDSESRITQLQITDITGQLVRTVNSNSNIKEVNVNELKEGLYFILAESIDGRVKPLRFIKR